MYILHANFTYYMTKGNESFSGRILNYSRWILSLVIIGLAFYSCTKSDTDVSNEPSDLQITITITDTAAGEVSIQAEAKNTTEYQLFIGQATEPEATSAEGLFTYIFTEPGEHLITVRAYGSSGKYIKATKSFTMVEEEPVSIEDGYVSPSTYEGYSLVWSDEFNGTEVNTQDWTFEIGNGCPNNCGWGNSELEYYRKENAWVTDGTLVIEARKENFNTNAFTSARMITKDKRSFQYGRIDIRALLPEGQGIWPALWMLGNNLPSVGWPKSGEIDIMEMIGGKGREKTVHGTLHWFVTEHAQAGGSYSLTTGTFNDEYHVFSIIWNETTIKWLVNNTPFYSINITPDHMTEFHQPHFFIFNLAVGGKWPGNPDASTRFPQQLKVDYIRVFQ